MAWFPEQRNIWLNSLLRQRAKDKSFGNRILVKAFGSLERASMYQHFESCFEMRGWRLSRKSTQGPGSNQLLQYSPWPEVCHLKHMKFSFYTGFKEPSQLMKIHVKHLIQRLAHSRNLVVTISTSSRLQLKATPLAFIFWYQWKQNWSESRPTNLGSGYGTSRRCRRELPGSEWTRYDKEGESVCCSLISFPRLYVLVAPQLSLRR